VATGLNVGGSFLVGGLAGENLGTITAAYATGNVEGIQSSRGVVGGLVGENDGTITQAYATGAVTGADYDADLGGLVGVNYGTITQTYATGTVSGGVSSSDLGGLIGGNGGGVTSSYWDVQSTGQTGSAGGTAIASTLLAQDLDTYATTYAGFDFQNFWSPPNQVGQNNGSATAYYPQLYALQHITAVDPAGSRQYGTDNSTAPALYYGVQAGDYVTTLATLTNAATSTSNIGSYSGSTAAGALTTSDGSLTTASGAAYRYVYLPTGVLTITPALLTITAVSDSRVYDGTIASSETPTYDALYGSDMVSGLVQAFASKDVMGTNGSTISVTGYTVNDGNGGANYTVSLATAAGTITPASLTITADDQSKLYGAALPTLTASYSAFANGDSAASLSTAPMLSTTATAASHVTSTPYAITASGAVDADYTISYVEGGLTITPASLTITANDASMIATGEPYPGPYSASYNGFVGIENVTALSGTLAFGGTAVTATAPGDYAVTPFGLRDDDYAISFVSGDLRILPVQNLPPSGATWPTSSAGPGDNVGGDGFEVWQQLCSHLPSAICGELPYPGNWQFGNYIGFVEP
jgi:hypothetical protein